MSNTPEQDVADALENQGGIYVYGEGTRCHCGRTLMFRETADTTDTGEHHFILRPCYLRDHLGIVKFRRGVFTPEG